MRIQRRFVTGVLAFLAALLLAGPVLHADGASSNPFKGVWRVRMVPDDDAMHNGAKEFDEAMVFDDVEMMAENFAYYGFEAGDYVAEGDDHLTTHMTMASGSNGNLVWAVQLSGTHTTGTLTWTKEDGTVWKFNFSGSKSN